MCMHIEVPNLISLWLLLRHNVFFVVHGNVLTHISWITYLLVNFINKM